MDAKNQFWKNFAEDPFVEFSQKGFVLFRTLQPQRGKPTDKYANRATTTNSSLPAELVDSPDTPHQHVSQRCRALPFVSAPWKE